MPSPPLALSIHSLIDKVGADAGFAAIIGLAVLVLILFAQAREAANLREDGAQADERLRQLEDRLGALARAQQAAASAPARAQPVQRPSARGVGIAPVGAPAGVGAPALAAATRLIATPPPAPARAAPAAPPPGALPASAPAAVPAGAPLPPGASPAAMPGAPGLPQAVPAVAATTASAASAGAPASTALAEPPLPPPATVAGAGTGAPNGARGGRGDDQAPSDVRLYRSSASAGRSPKPLLVPGRPLLYEPPWWRRFLVPILAAAALVAVAAVVVAITAAGSGSSASAARGRARRARGAGARVVARTVTVAVLNGTAINHLASGTATKLQATGYRIVLTGNAPSQTQTSTLVEYLAASERADALAVARTLGLSARNVAPAASSDRAVACQGTGACQEKVIVVVGQDLRSLAPAASTTSASTTAASTTTTAG